MKEILTKEEYIFNFHYYLYSNNKKTYQMDAFVKTEADKYLLELITTISNLYNVTIEIICLRQSPDVVSFRT